MKPTRCLLAFFASALLLHGANQGDEVVVIYNNRMPESKSVADHYAALRQVPTNQLFGFDLPVTEDISRAEFRDSLQKPLAKLLEKQKLWHIASRIVTETNGIPGHVEWRPVESKIRYAVLCYGVPLRIADDPTLIEPGMENSRPEMRVNEAAVDSELAILPMIEQSYPAFGPIRNWTYTTTNAATIHPTNGILMVTRLDGPTPEIARRLVDKAIAAETDGLWGRAYFDTRGLTATNFKLGDDWINAAAQLSRLAGFETTIDTNAATFPASFPMSHIALYAGWYDGDASGPFSLPQVEFMPGAFAYHIQSYSAATLRSATKNWVGPLLAKGVTCTMGCVSEPQLGGSPDIGTFFGRFIVYGFNFGEAAYASQTTLSWKTTVVGDPLYQPFAKNPQTLHLELEARKSPLIEWSHLKVVNVNLLKQIPVARMAAYLEDIPATKTSAVLNEKLGDLYTALGKPASTLRAYQTALKLNPSPMQRLRLRLTLGEKLSEQDRTADAIDDYNKLLEENPDYTGRQSISNKLAALEAKQSASPATSAPAN